jgi:hypothetical protein
MKPAIPQAIHWPHQSLIIELDLSNLELSNPELSNPDLEGDLANQGQDQSTSRIRRSICRRLKSALARPPQDTTSGPWVLARATPFMGSESAVLPVAEFR